MARRRRRRAGMPEYTPVEASIGALGEAAGVNGRPDLASMVERSRAGQSGLSPSGTYLGGLPPWYDQMGTQAKITALRGLPNSFIGSLRNPTTNMPLTDEEVARQGSGGGNYWNSVIGNMLFGHQIQHPRIAHANLSGSDISGVPVEQRLKNVVFGQGYDTSAATGVANEAYMQARQQGYDHSSAAQIAALAGRRRFGIPWWEGAE